MLGRLSGVFIESGSVAYDEDACFGGWDAWSHGLRLLHQKPSHRRMVACRLAVADRTAASACHFAIETKFSRNHGLGEIPFADKVRHHVDVVAIDHAKHFAEGGFLLPKAACHLRKKPHFADRSGMNERGSTGVRVHC